VTRVKTKPVHHVGAFADSDAASEVQQLLCRRKALPPDVRKIPGYCNPAVCEREPDLHPREASVMSISQSKSMQKQTSRRQVEFLALLELLVFIWLAPAAHEACAYQDHGQQ